MKQEEIQVLVDGKIRDGLTYQEIYDELDAAIPGREIDLAAMIAELPSMKQRKQFGPWKVLLTGGMAALIGMQVLTSIDVWRRTDGFLFSLSLVFPIVFGALWYSVHAWRSTSFKIVGYCALGSMVLWSWAEGTVLHWASMGTYALVGFLGIYLERQLGGKYTKVFRGHKEGPSGRLAVYEIKFLND